MRLKGLLAVVVAIGIAVTGATGPDATARSGNSRPSTHTLEPTGPGSRGYEVVLTPSSHTAAVQERRAAVNLIVNGGFEAGAEPWEMCGGAQRASRSRGPSTVYAGRFAARLGNPPTSVGCPKPPFPYELKQALWQEVTVPAGVPKLTLSFWYYVEGHTQTDLDVRLGTDLYTTLLDPGQDMLRSEENPGWQLYRRVLNGSEVTRLRGKTVLLAFVFPSTLIHHDDKPGKQIFRIDDVSLVQAEVRTATSLRPTALRGDGSRPIAFVREKGATLHLWRMDANGSKAVRIYSGQEGRIHVPDWSHNGRLIALSELVSAGDDAAYALTVVGPNGEDRREVNRLAPFDPAFPEYVEEYTGLGWAPNGKKIAVSRLLSVCPTLCPAGNPGEPTSGGTVAGSSVGIVDVTSGRRADLFEHANGADWGKTNRLLFEGYDLFGDEREWGVWQANMASARPKATPLVPGNLFAHDAWPAWAPDGRRFVTVRQTSVFQDDPLFPRVQGIMLFTMSDVRNGRMILLGDHGLSVSNPTWSADGRFILYNLGTKRGTNIWWLEVRTGKTGPLTRDNRSFDADWRP